MPTGSQASDRQYLYKAEAFDHLPNLGGSRKCIFNHAQPAVGVVSIEGEGSEASEHSKNIQLLLLKY